MITAPEVRILAMRQPAAQGRRSALGLETRWQKRHAGVRRRTAAIAFIRPGLAFSARLSALAVRIAAANPRPRS
jgi:hypothetical protein